MFCSAASAARADVYSRITEEIIAAIEHGPGDWRAPWHHNGTSIARPSNLGSGKRYRGINTVALWVAAMNRGYADGLWGTYRQWAAVGAQVRKGERATTVVFWKQVESGGGDAFEDDEGSRKKMFARAFSVFNVSQVDGYAAPPAVLLPEADRHAHAEAFINNLGIQTVFGGSEAFYRPSTDTVHMPTFECFRDPASFYGVWLHETGHASGAKHRLDRDLSGRFGTASYAAEECCVEILSGLILADLGIAHQSPDGLARAAHRDVSIDPAL